VRGGVAKIKSLPTIFGVAFELIELGNGNGLARTIEEENILHERGRCPIASASCPIFACAFGDPPKK